MQIEDVYFVRNMVVLNEKEFYNYSNEKKVFNFTTEIRIIKYTI